MDALAELAGEVGEELEDRTVELRLRAGQVDVVVSPTPEALDEPEPELDEPGEASRITLRLPEELKARAERAAAAQGSSLNTWLVQAVRDGVRTGGPRQPERRQHRVRGWVQG